MVATDRTRARFEELRSRYLAAKAKYDGHDVALRVKYGSEYQVSWLKAGDRKLLERQRAATDRAGDAFADYLATFSPRDWSYGVPIYWVRESLSFEDAARPLGEALSVVPPLSYGSTRAKT